MFKMAGKEIDLIFNITAKQKKGGFADSVNSDISKGSNESLTKSEFEKDTNTEIGLGKKTLNILKNIMGDGLLYGMSAMPLIAASIIKNIPLLIIGVLSVIFGEKAYNWIKDKLTKGDETTDTSGISNDISVTITNPEPQLETPDFFGQENNIKFDEFGNGISSQQTPQDTFDSMNPFTNISGADNVFVSDDKNNLAMKLTLDSTGFTSELSKISADTSITKPIENFDTALAKSIENETSKINSLVTGPYADLNKVLGEVVGKLDKLKGLKSTLSEVESIPIPETPVNTVFNGTNTSTNLLGGLIIEQPATIILDRLGQPMCGSPQQTTKTGYKVSNPYDQFQ